MIAGFVEDSTAKPYSFKELQAKLQLLKPELRKLEKANLRSNRSLSINKFCDLCRNNELPYGIEMIGQHRVCDSKGAEKKWQMYRFIRCCNIKE